MPHSIQLIFESRLSSSRQLVWEWMTDLTCVRREMWPYLYMTAPRHFKNLASDPFTPGKRLFRSYILYFGFLPLDYSDLTLMEVTDGYSLLESSPMLSMRFWQHKRELVEIHEGPPGVLLRDTLSFEPRFAIKFVAWFVKVFFKHRHSVIRRVHGHVSS